ncbi:MAG: helicase C-terminal domain-containing protein [Candidatus Cloacimonadales bacterium]|nr:helicase C-terminal domain-containing protein [Candidatus Cloacimonadales bacterium]
MIDDLNKEFSFVVFDIETTGLSSYNDEIIEIAAVRYEKGVKTDSFTSVIKPEREVSPFIYQLTQISPEELKKGISIKKALQNFLAFIKPNDMLMAHNSAFDMAFINAKSLKALNKRIYNDVLDNLDIARIFLPTLNNHKLETLVEHFNLYNEGAHRAINDAEVTGKVFYKIIEYAAENIALDTMNFLYNVADYSEYSPALISIFEILRKHIIKYSLIKGQKTNNEKNLNYIKHEPKNHASYGINDIFEENGLLNKSFVGYQVRKGQIDMANAVLAAQESNEFLLVEAGTGVGKSLAYLIPSIQFCFKKGEKVVVSTNTKNLQEQLIMKDLPLIQQAIDTPFTATIVKGRENYICIRKWKEIYSEFTINANVQNFSKLEAIGLLFIAVWAQNTKSGDISENTAFEGSEYSFIWKRAASERHLCIGKKCPEYGRCYLMDIRMKAEKSNIVIVNHSLLFSDFLNENNALGTFNYLVIDEAHNLLNSAAQHLGLSMAYYDVNGFITSLFYTGKKYQNGLLVNLKTNAMKSTFISSKKEQIVKTIDQMIDHIEDKHDCVPTLFKTIADYANGHNNYGKIRVKDITKFPDYIKHSKELINYLSVLLQSAEGLVALMKGIDSKTFVDYDNQMTAIEGICERLFEIINDIKTTQNPNIDDYTLWFSTIRAKDDKYPAGVINYAPIEVNKILPDLIFHKIKSIVFTSATLALRGSFKYFISNLGLDKTKEIVINELIADSPFDYDKQSLVLNTTYLPDNKDIYFSPQSIDLLKRIIAANKVGTMVLFTSYKDLNMAYDELSTVCYENKISLLAQGKTGSRSSILKEFIKQKNAVLLGTSSFWEGVDVQGESLSLLVLYKLPFQVPSEPTVEALIEKLEKQGLNSFMHYSLPNALLKVRQGFGRLIRSKQDSGVVLVLDNRIKTKRYGSYFAEILPTRIRFMQNPEQTLSNIKMWFDKIK